MNIDDAVEGLVDARLKRKEFEKEEKEFSEKIHGYMKVRRLSKIDACGHSIKRNIKERRQLSTEKAKQFLNEETIEKITDIIKYPVLNIVK